MKYLKPFFEAKDILSELKGNKDDIIRVFFEYSKLYIDGNTEALYEFIYNVSEEYISIEQMNEFYDNYNLTKEMVTSMVDFYIDNPGIRREIDNLLNLYYDCNYALGKNSNDIVDNIRDIFAEYLDDKKASFYKSSDKYDNRYIVEIKQDDILKTLDFNEIMGRLDDLVGLPQINYSGNNHFIKFEFFESWPEED